MFEICLNIPRLEDVILVVEKFDYSPPEPMTRDYPGAPEEATVTKSYLRLDCPLKNISEVNRFINSILLESNTLNKTLENNQDLITEKLLDLIADANQDLVDSEGDFEYQMMKENKHGLL